jgi:hypothetical protein
LNSVFRSKQSFVRSNEKRAANRFFFAFPIAPLSFAERSERKTRNDSEAVIPVFFGSFVCGGEVQSN